MDELTAKNFRALSQGLQDERSRVSELSQKVTRLESALSTGQQQIITLQQLVGLLTAKIQGNRSTTCT